jgi:sugar phosphate permease
MDERRVRRAAVLSVVFVGYCLCYIDRMVMATAIPYIGKDLALSKTAMGMVMSAFFVGYTAFQIPGGMSVDRYGPRRVMAAALTVWSLLTGLTAAVTGLVQMLVVRVLFGAAEGPYPAASMKTVALWFEPARRATATSIILSSNSLGPAVAPLLAVAIMAQWGWRVAFYSLVLPGLIVAALVSVLVRDHPQAGTGASAPPNAATPVPVRRQIAFQEILREPVVWKATLMFFLFNIAGWGFKSWLPTYLVSARHMSMQQMGVAVSLPFFAGIAGYLVGGRLSDGLFKRDRRIPVIVFQLATAVFLFLMYVVVSARVLILCQTAAGFTLTAALAATWACPMSAVSTTMTGRAIGVFNTGGQLAGLLSPTLIGYLVDVSHGGFASSFAVMIGCIVASSLVAVTLHVGSPPPEEAGRQ